MPNAAWFELENGRFAGAGELPAKGLEDPKAWFDVCLKLEATEPEKGNLEIPGLAKGSGGVCSYYFFKFEVDCC